MNLSNQKLKILIPITEFGKAGGLRVISKLANNWIRSGHEVTIVTNSKSILPYYDTEAKILWLNNKGEPESHEYSSKKATVKEKLLSIYYFLKKYSQDYNVILGNHSLTTIPIWRGCKGNRYYYIQAYEPGFYIGSNFSINSLKKFILWLTYFLPFTRIVNADIYKKYKNIRSKYVIPPGLDLDVYYPKKIKCINNDEIIVGCIGRHEEWKGSEDVAEAVKILHEKGYNVVFKVAFNPVKYNNHELVKPDGDENLANFYRSLDVLVAPGHIQLGAVHYPVIEAMACNVPVITTGYYPANEQNSFIVPIKSPEKIAEAIELILKDYTIAIGKAEQAKQMIKEFDWEIVSNKFIEIFKEELAYESIS